MEDEPASSAETTFETGRLLLRPLQPSDAAVMRELWTERDPRVPAHRRIDAHGRPSARDLEQSLRWETSSSIGLLAAERKGNPGQIGYCGLVSNSRAKEEPEIAFEFLRRFQGQGYATEASLAVLAWARSSGFERVWASVWEWNVTSRRVLEKLGFWEAERESHPLHGNNLLTATRF